MSEASSVERTVGRLDPEHARTCEQGCNGCDECTDFYYDDASEPDDGAWCDHCHGDGMDPECDGLLPCPKCQGEQRA